MEIQLRDEQFVLHHTGAMFHAGSNSVFVADLHLGKITHFRKHGFAVPAQARTATLEKLDLVLAKFQPANLIVLGDMFHSTGNSEWKELQNWRAERKLNVILVEGNHDILSTHDYDNAGIELTGRIETETLQFCHEPCEHETKLTVCGHIHPGVRLSGQGDQRMVLPCFYETTSYFVLPAFGTFTGKFLLDPGEATRVFVIAGENILVLDNTV